MKILMHLRPFRFHISLRRMREISNYMIGTSNSEVATFLSFPYDAIMQSFPNLGLRGRVAWIFMTTFLGSQLLKNWQFHFWSMTKDEVRRFIHWQGISITATSLSTPFIVQPSFQKFIELPSFSCHFCPLATWCHTQPMPFQDLESEFWIIIS